MIEDQIPSEDHGLPRYADRIQLAEIISRHYFPVSPRTLRDWPLVVCHPNKRAIYDVSEAMTYARQRLENAPRYRQSKG